MKFLIQIDNAQPLDARDIGEMLRAYIQPPGSAPIIVTPLSDRTIAALPRPHSIGVWDFQSLVECLKVNWEQAFPNLPYMDPQDAIQRMAAEIMNQRKLLSTYTYPDDPDKTVFCGTYGTAVGLEE